MTEDEMVWVSSGSWWCTGKPGMLQSMGSQNQTWLSNWIELNWSRVTLMYSFPNFEPVRCSMSGSNCCFLSDIQVLQEAGKVVWYSYLFKNFPQFIVIHIVKDFSVINEAEVDVFLEFSCFSMVQRMLEIWSLGISDTTRGWARLTCECSGVSDGDVGWLWPSMGSEHWLQQSLEAQCAGISPLEGGHHYCHYLHQSLASDQTTGREHSRTHQQKIGLKIYWACPCPPEQYPVFPAASPSHQKGSTNLLASSIRGQTEWKLQSQETNQSDGPQPRLTQWNYEPRRVGPPKTDGS